MEEFELPKEWFIVINDDNRVIINNWKIKQYYNDDLLEHTNYNMVKQNGAGGKQSKENILSIKETYFEITTEQFQEYVLGITPKEKEILQSFDYLIELFKKLNIQ